MNCPHCLTANSPESNYCKNCGKELTLETIIIPNQNNRDILWLCGYISWHLVSLIYYIYMARVIVPDMIKSEKQERIGDLYKTTDLITSVIDLLLLLALVVLMKNKTARIVCAICLVARVVILGINK